ncbi:MAG: prepilin-type N-terminal cleavage/methylation domain-containing protein [Polyangiales bacterium]
MKRRASAPPPQGFTLVEVLIAVAILAMSLSAVFGSNIGAARSTAHARALTRAVTMARCRLVEAEAYLVVNQLPAADQPLEDPPAMGAEPCCTDGVTCDVMVEQVKLPSPLDPENGGGDILGRAAGAAQGSRFGGGGDGGVAPSTPLPGGGGADTGSPLGALAGAMSMLGSSGGSTTGGSSGGASSLGQAGAPSPRDLASSLLGSVYPAVQPMLEGAIRRLTVRVRWREGTREHSFSVVEYVTNPGQTLAGGDPSSQIQNAINAATGQGGTGATGTPTSPTIPPRPPGMLPTGLPPGFGATP